MTIKGTQTGNMGCFRFIVCVYLTVEICVGCCCVSGGDLTRSDPPLVLKQYTTDSASWISQSPGVPTVRGLQTAKQAFYMHRNKTKRAEFLTFGFLSAHKRQPWLLTLVLSFSSAAKVKKCHHGSLGIGRLMQCGSWERGCRNAITHSSFSSHTNLLRFILHAHLRY